MNTDVEFKNSFSELAYSTLQNSFPELLTKVEGFQVVNCSDDKTKAVAFFAVKLGSAFYYIPVFFISGRVKPLELMYDKNNDRFFPLEREWISLILKDYLPEMGLAGKLPAVGLSRPNLEPYANPPRTGRVVTSSSKLTESEIDKLLTKEAKVTRPLPLIMASASKVVKQAFLSLMKNNPDYTEKLLNFYPWEVIKQSCAFSKREPRQEELFKIFDSVLDKQASANNKKQILEEGFSVLDKRAETSDVYFTDKIMKFQSCSDTGIYKIMDSLGEVSNYLVVQAPGDKFMSCSMDKDSRVFVIDPKDGMLYNFKAKNLLGEKNHKDSVAADAMLAACPSVVECKVGKKYVMVLKNGANYVATEPFTTHDKKSGEGFYEFQGRNDRGECIKIVVKDGSNSLGRASVNTYVVTPDVKLMPISGRGDSSKFKNQNPGLLEVRAYDNNLQKIEIITDGVEFSIRGARDTSCNLTKKAAVETLCLDYGIKGSLAVGLVKEAEELRKTSCFVKQAVGPYGDPRVMASPGQYSMPGMQGLTTPPIHPSQYSPEQFYKEQTIPLAPAQGRQGFHASVGMDNIAEQPDFSSALAGAQTGDQNILEASTLTSLSNFSDIEDLISEYIPDLVKAVDRLGRMIFLYWYRPEKFVDKYSESELKATEDSLRNLFKELGKVVYKFKTEKKKVIDMLK